MRDLEHSQLLGHPFGNFNGADGDTFTSCDVDCDDVSMRKVARREAGIDSGGLQTRCQRSPPPAQRHVADFCTLLDQQMQGRENFRKEIIRETSRLFQSSIRHFKPVELHAQNMKWRTLPSAQCVWAPARSDATCLPQASGAFVAKKRHRT
jgi:hypothetical protein